jgi:putative peptide zinc metalloprotease protein
MHQVKKKRFFSVLFVVGALIAALLLIPVPHKLRCDIVVVPEKISAVYVEEPGVLDECYVEPGDVVTEGQEIARLRNYQLEEQILEAEGRVQVKKKQLVAARTTMIRGYGGAAKLEHFKRKSTRRSLCFPIFEFERRS